MDKERVFECIHCGQLVQGFHLAGDHLCGDHPNEMREVTDWEEDLAQGQ